MVAVASLRQCLGLGREAMGAGAGRRNGTRGIIKEGRLGLVMHRGLMIDRLFDTTNSLGMRRWQSEGLVEGGRLMDWLMMHWGLLNSRLLSVGSTGIRTCPLSVFTRQYIALRDLEAWAMMFDLRRRGYVPMADSTLTFSLSLAVVAFCPREAIIVCNADDTLRILALMIDGRCLSGTGKASVIGHGTGDAALLSRLSGLG